MKIGFSPESIVGLDGMPLVGRVTLFAHDSDTAINVYTLEGDTFVQAQNPQLLNNAGRLDNTLFFDSAIVDVLVERYIGAEGMMSVDSPDSDFETFDCFEFGFDTSSIEGAETVDTIAQLIDADPSKRFVNVMGYYAVGDCAPRLYYWDSDSVNDIDGGYVIGSNVEDSGRWILLWDDELIPSSVYGIVAGTNETNINAFLNYPDVVGSFRMKTARVVRFLPGDYSSDVGFATEKEVAFDAGARFAEASFTLPKMYVIGKSTDFIAADFAFSAYDSVAHSAWFKTIAGFITCGAKRLVVDSVDFFANKTLSTATTIADTTIEWTTNTRLPVTYTDSGRIVFNRCNFVGSKMFNATDIVAFANMVFDDSWFAMTAADFDFTDKISARSSSGVSLLLSKFRFVDAYVKAVEADSQTTLNLEGRKAGTITTYRFKDIRNVVCDTLNVIQPGEEVNIRNVKTEALSVEANIVNIDASDVRFAFQPVANYVYATRSTLKSSTDWERNDVYIDFKDCELLINFSYANDNEEAGRSVNLFNCILNNSRINVKKIKASGCRFSSCALKVYPYKNNGAYYISLDAANCVFDSEVPVELTKFDRVDGVDDDECYGCKLELRLVNCTFEGNEEGVRCRYWMNRSGQYSTREFISEVGNDVLCVGNAGKCPATDLRGVRITDNTDYTSQDIGGVTIYKYEKAKRRCFNYGGLWYDVYVDDPGKLTKYYKTGGDPLTDSLFRNFFMLYHTAIDSDDNGDFFELAICLPGTYLRIGQPGGGDKNTDVVGEVV